EQKSGSPARAVPNKSQGPVGGVRASSFEQWPQVLDVQLVARNVPAPSLAAAEATVVLRVDNGAARREVGDEGQVEAGVLAHAVRDYQHRTGLTVGRLPALHKEANAVRRAHVLDVVRHVCQLLRSHWGVRSYAIAACCRRS